MRSTSATESTDWLPAALATDADSTGAASVTLRAALHAAATIAVDAELDLDAWMQAAWAAYVEQRPGLRAHLEEVQLAHQIEALRQRGQVGQA